MERKIDHGRTPTPLFRTDSTTVGDVIDWHITGMLEVGKPMRRTKSFMMEALKAQLGRARQGAGPVTISMDIGYLKLIVSHAAAVHGIDISPEPMDMARIALKRLELIGKSRERDCRLKPNELH